MECDQQPGLNAMLKNAISGEMVERHFKSTYRTILVATLQIYQYLGAGASLILQIEIGISSLNIQVVEASLLDDFPAGKRHLFVLSMSPFLQRNNAYTPH